MHFLTRKILKTNVTRPLHSSYMYMYVHVTLKRGEEIKSYGCVKS